MMTVIGKVLLRTFIKIGMAAVSEAVLIPTAIDMLYWAAKKTRTNIDDDLISRIRDELFHKNVIEPTTQDR